MQKTGRIHNQPVVERGQDKEDARKRSAVVLSCSGSSLRRLSSSSMLLCI